MTWHWSCLHDSQVTSTAEWEEGDVDGALRAGFLAVDANMRQERVSKNTRLGAMDDRRWGMSVRANWLFQCVGSGQLWTDALDARGL